MAIIKIRVETRNGMAQKIVDDLDAGAGPSVLEFYTATQPAGPATAITDQVLLGELVCSDPVADIENGVVIFREITQDPAANVGGIATWARHKNGDGVAINDYDVTDEEGTGAIKLNTVLIVAGGPIQMASLVIPIGGA